MKGIQIQTMVRPNIWDALVLSTAAIIAVLALMTTAVLTGIINLNNFSGLTTALIISLQSLGMVIGVYLGARFIRRLNASDLGLTGVRPLSIIKAVILGVVVYGAAAFVTSIIDPEVYKAAQDMFIGGHMTWLSILAAIVAAVIFAPIAEEILFRGVLFQGLFNTWGFWPAALCSSVIFGALHYHPDHWIWPMATFILGVILCQLTRHYRSIIPAIVLHAVYNAIGMTLTFAVV